MSGGVDSSVAAALLVEAGHDVTGVHLKLADLPVGDQMPGHGCCTLDDAQDARRVAQVLDIPFYVWDLSDVFEREVQRPFAGAYASGRTPNPCITCNERVKYAALLDRARRLGFDALATGHHVRFRRDGDDVRMLRAVDRPKDQTYVLYVATQEQLRHTLFPVGELTKAQVRDVAHDRGLRVATKPDSYDVCFIPGDTGEYLRGRLPVVTGSIVDIDGAVVGAHDGVWGFTVGQRRGLRLASHERRYVVDVDAQRGEIRVGPRTALACSWVQLDDVNWTRGAPAAGPVCAQVRAHAPTVPAEVQHHAGGWQVTFDQPVEAIAVGQACVLYTQDDDECLGGGTIAAADRAAATTVRAVPATVGE